MKVKTVSVTLDELDDFGAQCTPKSEFNDFRPLKFKQDPLALSWASYGAWLRNPSHRWADFNDVEAYQHDIEMAKVTREFYRGQLTIDALKGQVFSNFRTALGEIVSSDDFELQQKHLGIIYRLPYFYIEDNARGTLGKQFTTWPTENSKNNVEEIREITYIKTILKSRRARETYEFWFRDGNGHPVMLPVDSQNSLLPLVTSFIKKQGTTPFDIKGTFFIQSVPGGLFLYWKLVKPEIA